MFRNIQRLSFVVVAAVPALMGADGNGCTPPPGPGTGGTTGGGACAEQQARILGGFPGCTRFDAYRWDGYSCATIGGCVGTCVGADCDALYGDKESCLAAHSGCPGYVCGNQNRAFIDFVEQHRSCASDADCTSVRSSCINSDCPVYVNTSADASTLEYLMRNINFCISGDTSPQRGCLTWCQDPRPPACIDGVCAAKP